MAIKRSRLRALFATLLAVSFTAAPIFAQAPSADDSAQPTQITLYPEPAPRPALKYLLLPPLIDQFPGNAAVDYGKVTAEESHFFHNHELQQQISELSTAPLADFLKPEIAEKLGAESILNKLRTAARRESVDWQIPIREEPLYSILLSEFQQTRTFSWFLAARARLHIARGEFDQAIDVLQTGYALARHDAEGETLITGLIGIAIASSMSAQVQEFIQQPGAPNLYWALTQLPSPLVDISPGIATERNFLELCAPELAHITEDNWTENYWQQFREQSLNEFAVIGFLDQPFPEAHFTLLALKYTPAARAFLLARGYSAEQLDRMQAPQLILLHSVLLYRELADEEFKWFNTSYAETYERSQAALRKRLVEYESQMPIRFASLLLPSIAPIRTAVARNDRQIAVLRTLEALRLYGAAHKGQLPTSLNDLDVPVPVDPATASPFAYSVKDNVATLSGPELSGAPLRLEIRFAEHKPKQ